VTAPPGDGTTYQPELLAALRAELQEERARKASLDSRSLTIAAASATATTLLLGLGKDYGGKWPKVFFGLLFLGSICFLIASVLGWTNSRPLIYQEIDTKTFDEVLEKGWDKTREEFQNYMSEGALAALTDARTKNHDKADQFSRALQFLVFGAGIVSVELFLVFLSHVVS
jgi:hypothetical protein